jgi:hypothetical protein
VLGLAGLLCGHPYDVPDWAPAVVSQLAGHSCDPSPVPPAHPAPRSPLALSGGGAVRGPGWAQIDATVRKVLSEFKRTHADVWDEVHSLKFSADELSSLQDALIVPHSMFA